MKKIIGKAILKTFRFDVDVKKRPEMLHSVMICAPHTSNWDFLLALGTFWYLAIPWRFFVKDIYTKNIFVGWFFKWVGAIGVNRVKRKNLTAYAIELLKENDPMVILVSAEGTRERVDKWKTGFYYIAKGAGVPVCLGYGDYKKRIIGMGRVMYPTDNFKGDMKCIEDFYKNIQGKYPENYNPKIF